MVKKTNMCQKIVFFTGFIVSLSLIYLWNWGMNFKNWLYYKSVARLTKKYYSNKEKD